MDGYDDATYGDRFVDVYDDWYGDLTDTDACVDAVARLADGGAVLELGVGTGRLALPLAERGLAVTGVDTSQAMLDSMAAKPGGDRVEALLGDMTDPPTGDRRFAVVLVAYNTLFNLTGDGDQARCVLGAARRLAPGGCLVAEAFVPDVDGEAADVVTPKQVTADEVVLSVSRSRPDRQEVVGQYVSFTEAGGVRLRPWHIRWSTPEQLDAMADAAGLRPAERWGDWRGRAFRPDDTTHVSIYRSA